MTSARGTTRCSRPSCCRARGPVATRGSCSCPAVASPSPCARGRGDPPCSDGSTKPSRRSRDFPATTPHQGAHMKFGIFYEHQLPRPWDEGAEHKLLKDAVEQ